MGRCSQLRVAGCRSMPAADLVVGTWSGTPSVRILRRTQPCIGSLVGSLKQCQLRSCQQMTGANFGAQALDLDGVWHVIRANPRWDQERRADRCALTQHAGRLAWLTGYCDCGASVHRAVLDDLWRAPLTLLSRVIDAHVRRLVTITGEERGEHCDEACCCGADEEHEQAEKYHRADDAANDPRSQGRRR